MSDSLTTENVNSTTPETTDTLYTGDSNALEGTNVFSTPSDQDGNSVASANGGNVINVDNDFGGNLESAIAAANAGDVIELGSNTYYTAGITIDKQLTISGQEGCVIDGTGTSAAILNLTPNASGSTIEGIELTNANNGIYGFGSHDLTLRNLDINNIGINQPMREGENNSGIILNQADGVNISDCNISDVGRKGIGLGDTHGGTVNNVTVNNVNLAAQHAQNHDASGIKLFNTTDMDVTNNRFSNINAHSIWIDTNTGATVKNNVVEDVGTDFIAPGFNSEVGSIYGFYDEKNVNSDVSGNTINAADGFTAYNATEFTAETLSLGENNFSSQEVGSTDFYANEQAERLVATTENPTEANFDLFASDYYAQAII